MAAKVISGGESIPVKQLCVLIYGQPGARKTSCVQTCEKPITFAFDQGIYRAFGRKDAAFFDSWQDVISFDTAGFKTVVVDTIGMCLDKLADAVIKESPKNGNRMGGLSLPGYGVLKNYFAAWLAGIRQKGQDVVFVAHEKLDKKGDSDYSRPDIVGSNYNTVMNVADLVGYMHFENGKKVVDFNPTDSWMAKTPPCGWGTIALPDFASAPTFLADLVAEAKASMGKISAQSSSIAEEVATWTEWLTSLADCEHPVEALNDELEKLKELTLPAKTQVWNAILAHAKVNNWKFNLATKNFEVVA